MNEQMLEQQSEEVLMVEVSDEALEAAGGSELLGVTFGLTCNAVTWGPMGPRRC